MTNIIGISDATIITFGLGMVAGAVGIGVLVLIFAWWYYRKGNQ